MTSVGGGIEDGTGVLLTAGVPVVDSGLVSSLLLTRIAAWTLELGDDESFEDGSSLTGTLVNLPSTSGLRLRVTILLLIDFRRGAEVADAGLFAFVEAILTDYRDTSVKALGMKSQI